MKALRYFSFLILFFTVSIFGDPPVPIGDFIIRPLDPTTNLLSGMAWVSDGLIVCDRGAGTLLLIRNDRSVDVLLDELDTPVDVMEYGNEWLILQELEGSLIGVNRTTFKRRTIAEGFVHPTAFTLDDRDNAYIVEFDTGFLFKIDLNTGNVERLHGMLDRPADILFVKPDSLYIADQVGLDLNDGTVVVTHLDGKPIRYEKGIVDPTGLALSPSGDVYVSTFSIPMMGPHDGNRRPPLNGGVVRLRDRGRPEEIISGLTGPTSILFDKSGNLIVLEEPTDSIYRFSVSGEKLPLLEGFAPVDQASRNNNGDTFVIEKAPLDQFKIHKKGDGISTWEHPPFGMWNRIKMTVDGLGNIYLADPMTSSLLVFDESGNPIHSFSDMIPFYMMGVPEGGILFFPSFNPFSTVFRINPTSAIETFSIDLDGAFTTGFAKSKDRLTLCLANGEIQEFHLGTDEKHTVVPPRNRQTYRSSALDKQNRETFWALDTNDQILMWDGSDLIPAAYTNEPGLLLSDDDGVLFINNSGKRFLIEAERTSVPKWSLY